MLIKTKSYSFSIDSANTHRWFNKLDQFHNMKGPAIIYEWGSRMWCVGGEQMKVVFSRNDEGH